MRTSYELERDSEDCTADLSYPVSGEPFLLHWVNELAGGEMVCVHFTWGDLERSLRMPEDTFWALAEFLNDNRQILAELYGEELAVSGGPSRAPDTPAEEADTAPVSVEQECHIEHFCSPGTPGRVAPPGKVRGLDGKVYWPRIDAAARRSRAAAVLELRYDEKQSLRTIASTLGMSVNTVRDYLATWKYEDGRAAPTSVSGSDGKTYPAQRSITRTEERPR